jgi:tetratricopeptide (TPR) repeat protein
VYYEQAMAVYNEVGDRLGEAAVLNNLGVMALHQGDLGAAETHYERSLAIQRQIGNRYGEGICINNLGDVALLRGDYPSAREHLEQALVISEEIDDRVGVGIILGTLGAVALLAGAPAQAEARYLAAISVHESLNQAHFLAEDWVGMGKVKLAQGDETAASDYIQKVQDYLGENPRLEGLGNPILTFRFIWEALAALGRPEEAREVLTSAIELIEDYLAEQPEPELRAMYLSQPHHAALWAAWKNRASS